MRKYKTTDSVMIGDEKYPILFVVKEPLDSNEEEFQKYDLYCEREIYALAWWDIFQQAMEDYENGKLEEIKG